MTDDRYREVFPKTADLIDKAYLTSQPICAKCGKRPGTIQWSEGVIAHVHGQWSWRCERCATEEQLAFARARAEAIPDLTAKLAAIDAAEAEQ